jgi:hypothetical protein
MRGTYLTRCAVVGALTVGIVLGTAAVRAEDNGKTADSQPSATADTPVAACVDPPPERTGQLITEKSQSLQPAMALAALVETAPLQMMANPSAWWCSEKEFTAGSLAMQVWRSTRAANGVTSVQRIRVRDHSVTLYVVFSVLASAPLNKDRRAERLTWRAHVLYGPYEGGWAVYRAFDGEPDPERIAPLIADIVAGKLSPIAYIDDKRVTHFGER